MPEFSKAQPYKEAVAKISDRSPIASPLKSRDWSERVPVALRERAFFSATVENVRFLETAKSEIKDLLTGARGVNDKGESYLKTSRAQIVERLQQFGLQNGMKPQDPGAAGTLRDPTSQSRIELIIDTNMKSAQDYGYWKQGQDPDVLNAFPAQRFIRVADVRIPRPLHQYYDATVRLKSDMGFWLNMNSPDIGGFGVPWGPWGFNSGMDVEDVGRDDAEAMGLIQPGETPSPIEKDFNDHLSASLRGLGEQSRQFLQMAFGDQVAFEGDRVSWRGSGSSAPPINLPPIIDPKPTPPPIPQPAPIDTPDTLPVSDALELRVKGESLKRAREVLSIIDSVHDDGTLPRIPLTNKVAKGSDGTFYSNPYRGPVSIGIKRTRSTTAFNSAIHEIGHFLDLGGLGNNIRSGSLTSPDMQPWRDAVAKSEAFRLLREKQASNTSPRLAQYFNYMLSTKEAWARSYAQYIAEKSVNPQLLAELDILRAGNHALPANTFHWSEADFKPIREEIDALFKLKGWL